MIVGELLARARTDLHERGFLYVIRFNLNLVLTLLRYPVEVRVCRNRTFEYMWTSLPYFCHWYNITYANERAIEIPIARHFLSGIPRELILEVGNVLSHYGTGGHDVIDKFERAPGVINCDVVEYHPGKRYQRIVSISTMEHVGWDDRPRNPGKLPQAMMHLQDLLAPGGSFLITVPVGYNPEMDRMLDRGMPGCRTFSCYRKVGTDNTWLPCRWEDIRNTRWGSPYPYATGIVVGVWEKAPDKDLTSIPDPG